MNCQSVKPLLSEFADERLDVSTAWHVQTHLSECIACRQISRDMDALRGMLQALPPAGPSARFDDALAQRLALTRRPSAVPLSWQSSIARRFSLRSSTSARHLRPTLALGLVIAAGVFAALTPAHLHQQAAPRTVHSADPAFVADCVAQHHRDTAAEPLADLSAQSLAGSLDGSVSSTDPSADSSLF